MLGKGIMTSPNFGNAPATQPPMTDKEIRLECVKQAVILDPGSQGVISLADRMFQYVSTGSM